MAARKTHRGGNASLRLASWGEVPGQILFGLVESTDGLVLSAEGEWEPPDPKEAA